MYKKPEEVQKRIKVLIRNMRYLGVIATVVFVLCISIIIIGKGELYSIIPIIIFMSVWYMMFYTIYSYLAYKIPLEIEIHSKSINIETSGKEIVIKEIHSVELLEGVNHFILKTPYNKKYINLYIPKYLKDRYNLDKQVENMFKRGKRKVYYDFFIRFF